MTPRTPLAKTGTAYLDKVPVLSINGNSPVSSFCGKMSVSQYGGKCILINDYENKQRVLKLGLDRLEKQLHKQIYSCGLSASESGDYSGYDDAVLMYQGAQKDYGDDFMTAKNLNKSRYGRMARIREKNEIIIASGKGIFLTLTFSDSTLEQTTEQTRRRYVARYLKSQCSFYLANVDFGNINDREHYHAIVLPRNNKVSLAEWRENGQINAKKIKSNPLDNLRTAKYLAKLTYHAIKNNGLLKRLIYSRNLL